MIVSDAKLAANRRNAAKSTGPTSEAGKDRSRLNAVKHGLTAALVTPEDIETVQEEAEACFYSLCPRNRFQAELVNQVALVNVRTRRAQRIERRLRDQVSLRAMTCWDDDRRLEAERVGRDLKERPAEVVAELRRTPQGCDWILERWAGLASLAGETWPEDARRLAFDLLGTPHEFRAGNPGATIDPDGQSLDPGGDQAAVARAQIAANRGYREVAADHDEIARELTGADMVDEPTPEIRRLRRYESGLHRRLRWLLARLADEVPTNKPPRYLSPYYQGPEPELDAEAERKAKVEQERAEHEERMAAKDKAEEEAWEKAEARKRKRVAAREKADAKRFAEVGEEIERRGATAARIRDAKPARVPNEPTVKAPNEPTVKAPNEPIAAPSGRREAQIRKAGARREAKRRKLDRQRA